MYPMYILTNMMHCPLTESSHFFCLLHCTFLIYLCPLFPYPHLYVSRHFVSPFCPMSSEALKGPYGYPFTVNLPMYSKFQCWCLYGRILHCIHRSQLASHRRGGLIMLHSIKGTCGVLFGRGRREFHQHSVTGHF
jgi:hypothetical protein